MKVLTKALIRESEENAVKSGVSSFRKLMLCAGEKAAEIIQSKIDCVSKKVAVLCGNGNNGGDGCVIARYLYEHGAGVTLIIPMGEPVTEDAAYYYSMLPNSINITTVFENNYHIIIDALFGIGLNRPLDSKINQILKAANNSDAIKFSVDIPSGVEADTGKVLGVPFCADYTITFIAQKPCFLLPPGSDYCGEVIVADIGVKSEKYAYEIIEKPYFPKRKHNSHKGTFGTALLICGSYGMAGAAILAAKGALRSGVGIAKCVLCEGIYSPFTAAVPEAVCVPIKQNTLGTLDSFQINISKLTEKCKALLYGCGVGVSKDTKAILKAILSQSKVPIVLDADGINCMSECIELLKESQAQVIITPHPGEMAKLCKISVSEVEVDRINIARNFAMEHNCIVVLKGADTIVADKDGKVFFNTTGNPGMATGGCGDVLSGIMVSLLAQGYSPLFSAKAAVYLHGEAGDKAAARRNQASILPSDIIDEL